MNCPRCNAPVVYGTPFCSNCQLDFSQLSQAHYVQNFDSRNEIRYRKILIVIAMILIIEPLLWTIARYLVSVVPNIYDYTKPLTYLDVLMFAALPMVVGFLLDKKSKWRLALIIMGALWFVFRMYVVLKEFFFDNPYREFQF